VDVEKLLPQKTGAIEGIVDTGLVVIAHFKNPAQEVAFDFLSSVLSWERRCLIPTSAFLGAYHIMTRYLGVEKVAAQMALSRSLMSQSPALHGEISPDLARGSLSYASGYDVESWDGYILSLAKVVRAPVIYTVDRELARKVKDLVVHNPIPPEIFDQYNRWLREKLTSSSEGEQGL